MELRRDLESQTLSLKTDLLEQLTQANTKLHSLHTERAQSEDRFISFKQEFAMVLDERERVKDLCGRL